MALIPPAPDWLLSWSQVLSTFLTVIILLFTFIAYAVLAFLYKRQTDLLRVANEPSVSIIEAKYDDDDVVVQLSNYGGGLAREVGVRTAVRLPDGNEYQQSSKLPPIDDSGEHLLERSIGPQEQRVSYRGPAPFVYDDDKRFANFSTGITAALKEDVNQFEFRIFITYKNQFDEETEKPLEDIAHTVELDGTKAQRYETGELHPFLEIIAKESAIALW